MYRCDFLDITAVFLCPNKKTNEFDAKKWTLFSNNSNTTFGMYSPWAFIGVVCHIFRFRLTVGFWSLLVLVNPFTPKIKMQILRTIHIWNVWVMLWELIATSAIVWAKYKMPCSPLCTSYLWVEIEGRTFTLITFKSKRVKSAPGLVFLLSNPGTTCIPDGKEQLEKLCTQYVCNAEF